MTSYIRKIMHLFCIFYWSPIFFKIRCKREVGNRNLHPFCILFQKSRLVPFCNLFQHFYRTYFLLRPPERQILQQRDYNVLARRSVIQIQGNLCKNLHFQKIVTCFLFTSDGSISIRIKINFQMVSSWNTCTSTRYQHMKVSNNLVRWSNIRI